MTCRSMHKTITNVLFQSYNIVPFGRHFLLQVPGLAEKRPSVLRGDKIGVKASPGGGVEVEGEVVEVREKAVLVRFADDKSRSL